LVDEVNDAAPSVEVYDDTGEIPPPYDQVPKEAASLHVEHEVIDLDIEEANAAEDAMKMVRIRPRRTMSRIRVPHPRGDQPMWLALVANKDQVVPNYVRAWLFEKGML